jgi:hypothetical protein
MRTKAEIKERIESLESMIRATHKQLDASVSKQFRRMYREHIEVLTQQKKQLEWVLK